jgi:hypothetical protein
LVTPNLITNGQLTSDITNYGIYSAGANATVAWDNTAKITSAGSLKIMPATPSSNYSIIFGSKTSLGAVAVSKNYILRVTTRGTGNGVLRAFIRQFNAPYGDLTAKQSAGFGTSVKVHEFLFSAPTSDLTATFGIEVQESSGITYIDDLEFYEATTTAFDSTDKIRFDYNATSSPTIVSLGAIYLSVDSTTYNGTITLQPYTSSVLLKSGVITTSLKADAGNDITLILPTNSTTLKGSAVGSVTSYSWTKIAGPAQFTIASPNNPSTVISNLTVGTYTFQFKIVNSLGDSALSTVKVTTSGVLPVKLIDFTGNDNNNKIALQWKVASEINVSHYAIERSNDGHSFENIGQLKANNLLDIQINYNFSDNLPLKGINYYRLVMIDKDGSFTYSKIISLTVKNVSPFTLNNLSLSAINSNIKIGINSNYQQVLQLVLVDVSGRVIYSNPLELQKGFNSIDKKIPALNTGVYYAKLITNDQIITKSLLSNR